MFERMEIVESIQKVYLEPSYKKTTWSDATRDGHIRIKRGEAASSNTYHDMSVIAGNSRKRYADYPRSKSKPTCLIHCPGH